VSEHVLNYHLGDNASADFENATYVGLVTSLPIRVTELEPEPAAIQLILRTSNLETISPLQAHSVKLDGFEIGQLADTGSGDPETHTITLSRGLLRVGQPQRLTIEVAGLLPSLEDDFVLRSVTSVGAQLHLGWV
jgi:hypothetical protein